MIVAPVFAQNFAAERLPGERIAITLNQRQDELEIQYRNQRLLVYAFGPGQYKPYVRELYTLHGENVLRDAPADHLHHHGLMYAVKVNGENFWEEADKPGVQKSVKLLEHKIGRSKSGQPQAEFTQLIHWLAFTNRNVADSAKAALVIETRRLVLSVDETNKEVALEWSSQFEAGKNVGKLTLHGTQYNGLGFRMPKSCDLVVQFQNSKQAPYAGADSRNVIAANWSSISGPVDGLNVMAVLFSNAANAGTNRFFSLAKPFAYLSATQGLDLQPIEFSAGDHWVLEYLLTVYPQEKSPEFIENRYSQWSHK
ncbi:MAG: DUF6807 family protein [Limisphaerales bacterium]